MQSIGALFWKLFFSVHKIYPDKKYVTAKVEENTKKLLLPLERNFLFK